MTHGNGCSSLESIETIQQTGGHQDNHHNHQHHQDQDHGSNIMVFHQ